MKNINLNKIETDKHSSTSMAPKRKTNYLFVPAVGKQKNASASKHSITSLVPTKNKLTVQHKTSLKKNKENNYVLVVQGYHGGIVVAWIENWTTFEQPYIYSSNLFQEGYMSQLKSNWYHFVGLVDCKGKDGITPMKQSSGKTSHVCKQFLFLIHSEDDNTCTNRLNIATRLTRHINNNVSTGHNSTFPHYIEMQKNVTCTLKPVSDGLLDHDVKQLMMYIHADLEVHNLLTDENLMKKFWIDTEYGKQSMKVNHFHLLFIKSYQAGLCVVWIKNNQLHEEPDSDPHEIYEFPIDYSLKLEKLGFLGICFCKGTNGKTPMEQFSLKGNYKWHQFAFLVEPQNNTFKTRLNIATKMIKFLNKYAGCGQMYDIEYGIKFARDLTPAKLQPVSEALLDEDVKNLMLYTYFDYQADALVKHNTIMKTFWSDITYGKSIMLAK